MNYLFLTRLPSEVDQYFKNPSSIENIFYYPDMLILYFLCAGDVL